MMVTIVIGSVLFGAILGHVCKWYALLAACVLAIALVLTYAAPGMGSLPKIFFEIVIVTTSIQSGYCFGLLAPLVLRKRTHTYLSREASKNSKPPRTPKFRSVLHNSKPTLPPRRSPSTRLGARWNRSRS